MADGVFAGLRIVDLTIYGVGAMTSRFLCDHGAETIKVESYRHVDDIRMAPPFRDGIGGMDRSAYWAEYNHGRVAITLNLAKPEGADLLKRIVAVSDIVCENFVGGTAEKWGLAYEDLTKVKPDIIMIRLSMQGHTGPGSTHRGAGNTLQSLSGFNEYTGWPDRAAIGTGGPYTDFVVPGLSGSALLAALDYRERTGRGQYIDVSQLEAALHLILPGMLDFDLNGHVGMRDGNHDLNAAPHGAFPCTGDDRWIAIAVTSDGEWCALRTALGNPPWACDARFDSVEGRLAGQDEIEAHIAEWTVPQDARELMHRLQAAGVPAALVQHGGDLFDDPQLAHREHYVQLEHPVIGRHSYESPSFRLSRDPGRPQRHAPTFGQHNTYVFEELLGLSHAEVEGLMAAEVIY